MSRDVKMGGRVRSLRQREGLSQVDLAGRLAISPSYLNLIEHDQRPLTAPLLLKLAQLFQVELSAFAEEGESRLRASLDDVFGDPLFSGSDLPDEDLRALSTRPATAGAILKLYHAYRESREATKALASRLSDGGLDDRGVDPARLPSEEVSDLIQDSRNHFPELELFAEELTRTARLDSTDLYGGLVRYLASEHRTNVVITTVGAGPAGDDAVRRFDPARRILYLSELLPPRSRNFQLAHQIGLLSCAKELGILISRGILTTPDSVTLARVALANYVAGALLMPYQPFLDAARAVRYDIELLGHRFRTSFEQVCHRLTTLQRPGSEGVPLHLIRVDIAGNISKRFSASGIHFARYSGSCPRWNVHAAFMTPGTIRTQLSRMPDGTTYFCLARTIRKGRGGYGSPHTLLAIGLGCEVAYARQLVYADGVDLGNLDAAVPIGITCRLCERMDCEQRAFPPIQQRLSIDENVRGPSFYAHAAVNAR